MGATSYESVIVVLATGGALLEPEALDGLIGATVTWCRIEREGRVACLAARVRHIDPDSDSEFRHRVGVPSGGRRGCGAAGGGGGACPADAGARIHPRSRLR